MNLKVGKPLPSPYQRSDTGKWITHGTIAVHNDSELLSCDVELYGAEYDKKVDAVRNFCEKANRGFVKRWLDNGGAAQLHRRI